MFATIARIVAVSSLGAAMGSLPGMAAAADTPSALAGWTREAIMQAGAGV